MVTYARTPQWISPCSVFHQGLIKALYVYELQKRQAPPRQFIGPRSRRPFPSKHKKKRAKRKRGEAKELHVAPETTQKRKEKHDLGSDGVEAETIHVSREAVVWLEKRKVRVEGERNPLRPRNTRPGNKFRLKQKALVKPDLLEPLVINEEE